MAALDALEDRNVSCPCWKRNPILPELFPLSLGFSVLFDLSPLRQSEWEYYFHISSYYCTALVLLLLSSSSSSSSSLLLPLCRVFKTMHEKNHVPRVSSVAAVLYLQFVLNVTLFRPWNIFCTFALALPVECVQCPIWLFLQFLNCVLSWYVAQVLSGRWFQSPLLLRTCVTFAFTFHLRWISITRSSYFKIFSTSFLITFLCPGIATFSLQASSFFIVTNYDVRFIIIIISSSSSSMGRVAQSV